MVYSLKPVEQGAGAKNQFGFEEKELTEKAFLLFLGIYLCALCIIRALDLIQSCTK